MASITFLNFSGDVTITWDKTNEAEVLKLVEDKMKEGYSFFIKKPRLLGFFSKEVKAKSVYEVQKAGQATLRSEQAKHMAALATRVDDASVAGLLASGAASLAPPPVRDKADSMVRAKSAHEVVQAEQATAVRRVVGG